MNTPDSPNTPSAPRQESPQDGWRDICWSSARQIAALYPVPSGQYEDRLQELAMIVSMAISRSKQLDAPTPAAPTGQEREAWKLVLEWAIAASGFGMPSDPHERLTEIGKIAEAALAQTPKADMPTDGERYRFLRDGVGPEWFKAVEGIKGDCQTAQQKDAIVDSAMRTAKEKGGAQ